MTRTLPCTSRPASPQRGDSWPRPAPCVLGNDWTYSGAAGSLATATPQDPGPCCPLLPVPSALAEMLLTRSGPARSSFTWELLEVRGYLPAGYTCCPLRAGRAPGMRAGGGVDGGWRMDHR